MNFELVCIYCLKEILRDPQEHWLLDCLDVPEEVFKDLHQDALKSYNDSKDSNDKTDWNDSETTI